MATNDELTTITLTVQEAREIRHLAKLECSEVIIRIPRHLPTSATYPYLQLRLAALESIIEKVKDIR